MGVQVITPPATEPLSLAEIKDHVSMDDTALDGLLTSIGIAARNHVEDRCGRAIITQSWRLTLDAFPDPYKVQNGAIDLPGGPAQSVTGITYLDPLNDTFVVSGVTVTPTAGAIYTHNGLPFPVVSANITAGSGTLICGAVGMPLPSGTLTKVSGVGDATIAFSAFTATQQTLAPNLYKADLSGNVARIVPAYGQQWPQTQPIIGSVTVDYVVGYGDATAVPGGIKSAMRLLIGEMFDNREINVASRLTENTTVDNLIFPYRIIST